MKKILAILLAVLLTVGVLFALAACEKDKEIIIRVLENDTAKRKVTWTTCSTPSMKNTQGKTLRLWTPTWTNIPTWNLTVPTDTVPTCFIRQTTYL